MTTTPEQKLDRVRRAIKAYNACTRRVRFHQCQLPLLRPGTLLHEAHTASAQQWSRYAGVISEYLQCLTAQGGAS